MAKSSADLRVQTKHRHWLRRFKQGVVNIGSSRKLRLAYTSAIMILLAVYITHGWLWATNADNLPARAYSLIFDYCFPVVAAITIVASIILLATPFGGEKMADDFRRIGLVNAAGEPPQLLRRYKDKSANHVTVMEYDSRGLPLPKWEDMRGNIESILNLNIAKITQGSNNATVNLYTVPASAGLPDRIDWNDKYLEKDSAIYVLGKSLLGDVKVDINKTPHILLGGSTGSGKSVLLRLLLYQAIKKGAIVQVVDFKGAVDFNAYWDDWADIITDIDTAILKLDMLVQELARRKRLLRESKCRNIDEHNKKADLKLRRIIFGVDEIAEMLDKSGLDKTARDKQSKAEGMLATIARQGRAFGIHLILSTQRPDAAVVPGQIKNNIDYRVCGKADNVLSVIILDCGDAEDRIPKDSQGLFLDNTGTLFRAYYFDDELLQHIRW